MSVAYLSPQPDSLRPHPHNEEAEQALLGALMAFGNLPEAIDFLKPEHFFHSIHARIFETICDLVTMGSRPEPLFVAQKFGDEIIPQAAGTAAQPQTIKHYVASLTALATTPRVENFAAVIHDTFIRREIVASAREAMASAQDDYDTPATDLLRHTEESLFTLAESGETKRKAISMGDSARQCLQAIEEAYKNGGAKGQIRTRLIDLDKMLGGFMAPELTILAARPAMGKTALAMQIAENVAQQGIPVAFFSLEMGAGQLTHRRLAADTGITTDRQLEGRVSPAEMQKLIEAQARFERLPIYIDESSAVPVSYIVQAARRLVRRHGVKMVVIDYLGLIQPERNRGSRNDEVSQISGALKGLAKELRLPVLALAQLNRGVEGREDKRPDLSDLRDSGSIEQDADRVIFLYREEYYLSRQEPQQKAGENADKYRMAYAEWQERSHKARGKADLLIRKNRRGKTGDVSLQFDPERQSFGNLMGYHE